MREFSFRRCGGGTLSREVLSVLFCVACLSACSPFGIKTNGQDPWQIREGEFRASLLLTDDHEGLLETWKSSSDRLTPITRSLIHTEKGKPVYLVVTFSNCLESVGPFCEMRVDFTVNRPDGSVYGSYRDLRLWYGSPPIKDIAALGVAYMIFSADLEDPEGVYDVVATLRSVENNKEVSLRRQLAVGIPP